MVDPQSIKKLKISHGAHNKRICDKLHLEYQECPDWVVTTAFYSSIHYLDSKLFPCKHDDKEFVNISQAHSFLKTRSGSKHQTRGYLLSKYQGEFKGEYEFLLENSQTARYVDYNINEAIADKAVRYLERIIKGCQ